MKILREYKKGREGNDCWLCDYIVLIELDSDLFVVAHIDTVTGSWTGNPKTSRSEVFTDYSKALTYMNKLIADI